MEVRSYRDLKVWQKAMDFVEAVYQVTANFPKEEQYGLTTQLRRAVVSIPSDIAEGGARRSRGDYARFVNISSGSTAEVETQLMLAQRLGFMREAALQDLLLKAEEISKMLFALSRALIEKEDV